jgi:hypothetical protein
MDEIRLSSEERVWLIRDEARWRRAREIAGGDPRIDVNGVYRVLRNLEKTPSERLRDGLYHGRLRRPHPG